jgi:muramidase (phage lysozyme)
MTELGDNRKAFLTMISISEGTSTIEGSDNGYNVLVGGTLFDSYADHPRKLVTINSKIKSTAAGRYQLLSRYFDYYKTFLHLPDFSPASQDTIALQQIRECRALQDVDDGKIQNAINKCKGIWASLPGAGYGQRENKLDDLLIAYHNAGGTVA